MKSIVVAVTNDLTFDRRMQRICRTLSTAGHAVTLIGRECRDSVELVDEPFEQVRLRCLFNHGPAFYAEYNLRLLFFLLRHSYDIGVACDLDTALAVQFASKIQKRSSVFDAHELFTEVPELNNRSFVRSVWSRIGRWTVPKFELRYSVGQQLARVLTEKYQVPFEVVRNVPLGTQAEIPGLLERERIILYQGALNEGRGLESAIEAMQQIEGYQLHLAGEGDLSEILRKRVTDLGLESKVQFLGRISPTRLPDLALKATLGLNLLEKRSQSYYYSLANKFFDYMHAGLPSINMDFPEYRAIVNDQQVGVCIHDLKVDTIVQVIKGLIDDPPRLEQMILNCRTARQHYSWQTESRHLLQLYEDLVNR